MPGLSEWISVSDDFCTFDFSNVQFKKKSECIDYTVEKIIENGKNFYLALSGGLDSEFAANCLYERGVKFTPIIMDIFTNRIENWYAYRWCYEKKITPLVISMTEAEVANTFPKISLSKKIPFYVSIPLILSEIVLQKNGCLILGGEEIIDRDYLLSGKFEKMSENLDTNKYAYVVELENKNHIGGFLSYTPELFLNCLDELDYNKPGQLALAEYYGVLPRPKLNSSANLMFSNFLLQLKTTTDSKNPIINFKLGNKNDFIAAAKRREIVRVQSNKIFL